MAVKVGVGELQTRACSRGRAGVAQTESAVMEWHTWGRSVGLREAEVGDGFQVEVLEGVGGT